ncbi:hypothetical protein AB395_00006282 (plasmid) [Sinorhizobium fredii CCBAU 45436]|nr:hypothetical protein AB395_00006282 [Sinorhizobium fredii CCBAU 45436]
MASCRLQRLESVPCSKLILRTLTTKVISLMAGALALVL